MNLTQGNYNKYLFKEEQELTKYTNNIKTLINKQEEERLKRKAHLNKEGLFFFVFNRKKFNIRNLLLDKRIKTK